MRNKAPLLRTALEWAGLMALLLVNALFWDGQLPDDAGTGLQVTRFGFGYYLWFAVMIASVVALLLRARLASKKALQ